MKITTPMPWFLLTLGSEGGAADYARLPDLLDLAGNLERMRTRARAPAGEFRYFPRFGIAAVEAPEPCRQELASLPGVLEVAKEDWYLSLIEAWANVIEDFEGLEGAAVNLSLGPDPRKPNPFDPNEPLNRATRVAADHGIVAVLAAGNSGEQGDDTMSPWAMAGWVISVGATDAAGERVESYSSRGIRGGTIHPVVVAAGLQEPRSGDWGTSFAAPQVTDVSMQLIQFLLSLWKAAGQPPTPLKPLLPALVRRGLETMARPVSGEAHELGAGFVSREVASEFLSGLSFEQAGEWLGTPPWLTADALRAAQSDAADPRVLLQKNRVARFTIDTSYEWTLPSFVPGLLQYTGHFILRTGDRFEQRGNIRLATVPAGEAKYVQISLLATELGRRLQVGRQKGAFRKIKDALAQARSFDIVEIERGDYEESLQMAAGITLIGEPGTVVRHHSEPPIRIGGARDFCVQGLEIVAEGKACPAILGHGVNFTFVNCKITSRQSDAMYLVRTRRCLFRDCQLEGALHGAWVVYGSQCYWLNTAVAGERTGLVLYGSSAKLSACVVEGRQGEGIMFIPPSAPWTDQPEATVFTYPVGVFNIRSSDVCSGAVQGEGIVNELSSLLCGLTLEDTRLLGGRVGFATSDFGATRIIRGSLQGGRSDAALIQSERALPVAVPDDVGFPSVMAAVDESLRALRFVLPAPPPR